MNAPDIELADAIVADINSSSRSWTLPLQAERTWKPLWIGKDKLEDLQCLVNPWPVVESEAYERKQSLEYYSIDFGIAKRLDGKDRNEIDSLRNLVDSMIERYKLQDFAVSGMGNFRSGRYLDEYVAFDPSRLSSETSGSKRHISGYFLSMFRVRYRYMRSPS